MLTLVRLYFSEQEALSRCYNPCTYTNLFHSHGVCCYFPFLGAGLRHGGGQQLAELSAGKQGSWELNAGPWAPDPCAWPLRSPAFPSQYLHSTSPLNCFGYCPMVSWCHFRPTDKLKLVIFSPKLAIHLISPGDTTVSLSTGVSILVSTWPHDPLSP